MLRGFTAGTVETKGGNEPRPPEDERPEDEVTKSKISNVMCEFFTRLFKVISNVLFG